MSKNAKKTFTFLVTSDLSLQINELLNKINYHPSLLHYNRLMNIYFSHSKKFIFFQTKKKIKINKNKDVLLFLYQIIQTK